MDLALASSASSLSASRPMKNVASVAVKYSNTANPWSASNSRRASAVLGQYSDPRDVNSIAVHQSAAPYEVKPPGT